MVDIMDDSGIVDPWGESDAEPDYNPWEPCFPSTAWGRLSKAGWHGAEFPSQLMRRCIAVLIVVRNHLAVPIQEGMWGSGGPRLNDKGWIDEFGCYQYFWLEVAVLIFLHLGGGECGASVFSHGLLPVTDPHTTDDITRKQRQGCNMAMMSSSATNLESISDHLAA
jgi:hypothetical protein